MVSSVGYLLCRHQEMKTNLLPQGIPVVWSMVVFTLFIVEPGEMAAFGVVFCRNPDFAPIRFLHPVRVVRMRAINLPIFLVWCGFGGAGLFYAMDAPDWVEDRNGFGQAFVL